MSSSTADAMSPRADTGPGGSAAVLRRTQGSRLGSADIDAGPSRTPLDRGGCSRDHALHHGLHQGPSRQRSNRQSYRYFAVHLIVVVCMN